MLVRIALSPNCIPKYKMTDTIACLPEDQIQYTSFY